MVLKKLLPSALLCGAFLATGAAYAQQDTTQALLDLLVRKGLISAQDAQDLKAQVQANAAAAAQATPPTAPAPAMAPSGEKVPVESGSSSTTGVTNSLTDNGLVTSPPGKSPIAFRIGKTDFTPVGFMDFTTAYRSTLNGGDIGSSFASFPYSNTANGQLSETRFSAKNSRLGLKIDSSIGDAKVLGYVETDFLGNAATSINVASNSDVMRMRVYFVDVQKGDWEFLAGQDWSMLTPNRKGLSPMPNDIFYSQDMDTNYQLGLVWERTPQIRVVYHPASEWAVGFAAENPDQYVGSVTTLPSGFTSTEVDNGSNGTATPNTIPDLVGKIAYDTTFGDLPFHAEVAGVYRSYKINTYVTSTGQSSDSTANGYGGSFNVFLHLTPTFLLVGNGYMDQGAGREISTGVAPDFVVTGPDAATGAYDIQTVSSYADLGGFEWDVLPVTKLFAYYGQVHVGNSYQRLSSGSYVGYGYPGSSNSANKQIEEYTGGLTQVFWKSASCGDLKLILQYSYMDRDPWNIAAGTPSSAHINMFFADLRYDLP